jgi:hypothetical protein
VTVSLIPHASWLPRTYDRWVPCPDCGVTDLGVRVVHAEMQLLAAHTAGYRRVLSKDRPRCPASERNVAPLASAAQEVR